MKKYGANRDKLFVCLVWKTLRGLITYSSLATVILTTAISIGILLFAERIAERNNYSLGLQDSKSQSLNESAEPSKFWGLSKAAWLGVSGSIFASAVFWLVQGVMYLFNQAKEDTYEEVYRTIVEENGLTAILSRKGGDEATTKYKKAIAGARERVWAIGMSNKHFTLQHLDSVIELAKRRPGLDIVVAFWSPNAYLQTRKAHPGGVDSSTTPKHRRKGRSERVNALSLDEGLPVFVVQAMLEGREPGTAKEIQNRQTFIIDKVNQEKGLLKGRIRVVNLSLVTYVSCIIMDSDVFFFPYLSGEDSTDSPMFHCDATRGVGAQIYSHVKRLLDDRNYEIFREQVFCSSDNRE